MNISKKIFYQLIASTILSVNVLIGQDTPNHNIPLNNSQQSAITQPKQFENFKDRLFLGGNVGASFGSITFINLSPIVGIKINKEFSVGTGFIYNYYSQSFAGRNYVSTIYGGNAFARYFVFENLFGQVGWDRLSVIDYRSSIINSRIWVDNILLGVGYRQLFSDNGALVAMIFYNVNQTPLSPYQNPIIQIGFNIGL
ncbi:MAG: hypothetical protein ACK504_04340 [Bacteroidota bacterium]